MPRFSSRSHRMIDTTTWDPALPADQVNDHIWTSAGTTDSHLVTTPDGDVVINTGFHHQGARHRQRYEEALGRPLEVRKLVFTQAYWEQVGGWKAFDDPGVEKVAQHNFHPGYLDQQVLGQFFLPRNVKVLSSLMAPHLMESQWSDTVEPAIDTLFHDTHAFEVGGRRFELLSVPGGEATECLAVWLPEERTVFTGNLTGALYGALPNLYTIRGARIRSAGLFLRSMQRVLDLEPELHITGHDEPIHGAERIRTDMTRVMEAVAYIQDRTIEGMNQGKELWTLMQEIRLPEHLEPQPGRGPVWWYVRAVWEEYAGYARFESTTELYGVPPKAVWGDLAELAGGPDALAERASKRLAQGEALEAVHLLDVALSVDPAHPAALEVQLAAHELLLDRAGDNFDELNYLENEIARLRAATGG